MNQSIEIPNSLFSRTIEGFGTINLRPFNLEQDIDIIYDWVTRPYATYWGMTTKTIEEVIQEYRTLSSLPHYEVLIGMYKGKPAFLMEKYKASEDRIASYYQVKEGDFGMHILVGPPDHKIAGFTWNVFTTIQAYFFAQPHVVRMVVEPDVRNEKIHALNKKAGFRYQKEIELPEKRATLAFCERADYEMSRNN
ncbi:GNAT family N-acetyltransferase [Aquimarina sp. 2201CG1-2-11]|uniref:GNAT family N-acetyltransferase n=1 Tax=Aquimarina discodermiae TaxID=3231043 RepID=UPI003462374D